MKKLIILGYYSLSIFSLFSQENKARISNHTVFESLIDSLDTNSEYVINQASILIKEADNKHDIYYFQACASQALGYYSLNQDDSLIIALNLIEEICLQNAIQKELNGTIADYYCLLGDYFYGKGNWKKSLTAFQKAYLFKNQSIQNRSYLNLIHIIYQLSENYFNTGNYKESIKYSEKTYSLNEHLYYRGASLNNIAECYMELKNYDDALLFYKKAISLFDTQQKNTKDDLERIGTFLINIGECFSNKENYDSAFFYLEKSQPYVKNNWPLLAKIQMEKGLLYTKFEQFNKAKNAFNQSITYHRKEGENKNSKIGKVYLNIGRMLVKKQDWQNALQAIQKAIPHFVSDFNDTLNLSANPSLNHVNSKVLLVETLAEKANVQIQIGATGEALQTILIVDKLLDKMRINDLYGHQSKYILLEKAKLIYEKGIELALILNKKVLVHQFCQKSHATVLWEMVQNITANNLGNVPDSLLEKEKRLKMTIAAKKGNTIKEQETLIQLRKKLESKYPRYYQLKYADQTIDLKTIQKALQKEEVLVEYFIGEHSIYTFVISSRDFKTYQQEKSPEFLTHITQLRQMISQYNSSQETFDKYTTAAHSLYETLLKKVVTDFPAKHLIIIPDEELGFLNFGLLLADMPATNAPRYDQLPYLIKQYYFSYNYSSALFIELKKIEKRRSNLGMLVGFAPAFPGTPTIKRQGERLDSLIHNLPEVKYIGGLFNGIIHTGKGATSTNFKKSTQQYKIAHLATHASCDDLNPENSKIHFADTSLTCTEIYNFDLNFEMVVLSACETGSGKLQKGEGVISLARAFMSAGCPSVVTSLWQVNDHRTADLMKLFYENIRKEQPKHVALGDAQRAYLKQKDLDASYTHPYYWGAFVAIGNVEAISDDGLACYWWGFGGVCLLALLFLVRRYR